MQGYIQIPNWDGKDGFQHYKDRRPSWIKLHLSLLGNDAWHELSAADRCLLMTIWMLVAIHGNGRLRADQRWLMAQANLPIGPRSNNLERLNDAGFIRIASSKSVSERSGSDSPEKEGSKEPKRESAASSAPRNGAARRRHQKHLDTAVATAREWKLDDPDHLERDVRETWPDAADFILSRVAAIPAQNGENGSNHEKPAAQEPVSAPRADDRDQPVEDIDDMDIPF
jgi:hypothetical protein